MNLLKMFNIFIYKISDVDTNHVNVPLEKLQLALFPGPKTLNFYIWSVQIYIRCFQTTEIAINPHNTKRFLKKENYCVQIIEIMFTLKSPTFPSNLTVQLLKYEKGKN